MVTFERLTQNNCLKSRKRAFVYPSSRPFSSGAEIEKKMSLYKLLYQYKTGLKAQEHAETGVLCCMSREDLRFSGPCLPSWPPLRENLLWTQNMPGNDGSTCDDKGNKEFPPNS